MSNTKTRLPFGQHVFHAALFFFACWLLAKPNLNPYPEFGKAFGEAILIALLVIYLVEMHSHKRLEDTAQDMIRKIGKNIIPLVYGHELPPALVDALEASTLQQPIYRERMRLDVELVATELKRTDGAMEKICRLATTYRYALVNCSDQPVKQSIFAELERDKWLAERIAGDASNPWLDYVMVGDDIYVDDADAARVAGLLNLPADASTRPLEPAVKVTTDGNGLRFNGGTVEIPSKGRIEIMVCGVLFKRHSDNEMWSTAFPTLGVSLTVGSTDYEVEARFPPAKDGLSTNHGGLTKRWAYDAPLLAGQAVMYWWRPKKA